jgi:NAD(P)-dependent dehydrogenase (short-subunit alcohol dehydrogenase family)
VIDRIRQLNGSIKVDFIPTDLASNASVRDAAVQILRTVPQIDILINSGGVMALQDYQTSTDGIEMQFAACHVGHFLLTGLLMPKLVASKNARIISLTSMGYEASHVLLDNYNFSNGANYNPWVAYGQAKSANVMMIKELARRTAAKNLPVKALVLHPGLVLSSGILQNISMDELNKAMESSKKAAEANGEEFKPEEPKSIEQGIATTVYAAVAPDLQSGVFLKDCDVFPESEQKPWVKDADQASRLWKLSEELVGEKFL